MSMLSITDRTLEGFPSDWRRVLRNYNLSTAYGQIGTVYACVNVIANTISGIELGFFVDRPIAGGNGGQARAPMSRGWHGHAKVKQLISQQSKTLIPLPDTHGLVQLFNPPNRVETPSLTELIKFTSIMLMSDGEVFWVLEKQGQREPQEVRLVRGGRIKEVLSRDKSEIQGWIETDPQRPGDRGRPLTLDEVVPFKLPNPYNKYRGLSPLAAARLAIEQDFNMSTWNAGFFQGGVRNPIAILIKQKLEPKQRKEMEKVVRDHYQGFVKGQGPLLLDKGASIQNLAFSAKDIDFIEGKNLSREDLCSIYGVPPALIGVYRYANYANSDAQQQIFWKNTVIPIMVYVADTVQVNLVDIYWKGAMVDWAWETIQALKDNPRELAVAERQVAEATKIYAELGYSATQVAYILDRPELDPATHPDPSQLQIPATEAREISGREVPKIIHPTFLPPPCSSEEAGEAARPSLPVPSSDVEEVEPPVIVDEKDWTIIKVTDRFLAEYQAAVQRQVLDPTTAEMARTLRAYLAQISNTIVRRVERGGDGYLNPGIWIGVWLDLNLKNVRTPYLEGLRRAFIEVGSPEKALNGISKQQRLPLADLLTDYQIEVAQTTIESINRLTADPIGLMVEELNAVTRTHILAGATVAELRAALEDKVVELYQGRALAIARTTSGSAYSAARSQMFEAKGVKIHQWAASNDAHTRNTHARETGNRVTVGERFPITNMRYPLDPTGRAEERINCRCTTFPVAVKKPDTDRTTLTDDSVPPDAFSWQTTNDVAGIKSQMFNQFNIANVRLAYTGPESKKFLLGRANIIGRETTKMFNRLPQLSVIQKQVKEQAGRVERLRLRQVSLFDRPTALGGPKSGNLGVYYPDQNRLAVAAQAESSGSTYQISTPKKIVFNTGNGVEEIYRHEYGHYLQDAVGELATATQSYGKHYREMRVRWGKLWRDTITDVNKGPGWLQRRVSTYAASDSGEGFAEMFTIFSHSKYGKKGFLKLPKEFEDFFRDLLM